MEQILKKRTLQLWEAAAVIRRLHTDRRRICQNDERSLDEKSEQKKQEKTEQFQIKKENEGEEEQFALFVILRTELDNSKK